MPHNQGIGKPGRHYGANIPQLIDGDREHDLLVGVWSPRDIPIVDERELSELGVGRVEEGAEEEHDRDIDHEVGVGPMSGRSRALSMVEKIEGHDEEVEFDPIGNGCEQRPLEPRLLSENDIGGFVRSELPHVVEYQDCRVSATLLPGSFIRANISPPT